MEPPYPPPRWHRPEDSFTVQFHKAQQLVSVLILVLHLP